ncbi:MAG: serpin family protein [Bacteroidales bacterium]|nr:serpin family protein [Bacteroidales bacterium]
MKATNICVFAGVLALCAGCSSSESEPESIVIEEFEPVKLTASQSRVCGSATSFGWDLLAQVSKELGSAQNVAVSPISASFALAMAANGAQGQTRSEILDALGLGAYSMESVNDCMQALSSTLPNLDSSAKVALSNSFWHRASLPVLPSFTSIAAESYQADVCEINPSTFNSDVTRWCYDSTCGLIDDYGKNLDSGCAALILNAAYFKGVWGEGYKFESADTRRGDFSCAGGSTSKADFMTQTSTLGYARLSDCAMASLPFGNGAYRMDFVLPDEGAEMESCLGHLASSDWSALRSGLSSRLVELRLPKFQAEATMDLNGALQSLGVVTMFTQAADFSALSTEDLTVDKVKQGINVRIDETGAEAAAVTSVQYIYGTSGPRQDPEAIEFHLDRPFVFAITETSTGSILFAGVINKP